MGLLSASAGVFHRHRDVTPTFLSDQTLTPSRQPHHDHTDSGIFNLDACTVSFFVVWNHGSREMSLLIPSSQGISNIV